MDKEYKDYLSILPEERQEVYERVWRLVEDTKTLQMALAKGALRNEHDFVVWRSACLLLFEAFNTHSKFVSQPAENRARELAENHTLRVEQAKQASGRVVRLIVDEQPPAGNKDMWKYTEEMGLTYWTKKKTWWERFWGWWGEMIKNTIPYGG